MEADDEEGQSRRSMKAELLDNQYKAKGHRR
jgi:hypothetical protein